jgi:hypothetical protein
MYFMTINLDSLKNVSFTSKIEKMQLRGCVLIFFHLTKAGIPSLLTQVERMPARTDRNLNSAQADGNR